MDRLEYRSTDGGVEIWSKDSANTEVDAIGISEAIQVIRAAEQERQAKMHPTALFIEALELL